jgi:hypothetical protein
VSIDWEDSKNRTALRKAILAVYPDRTDFEMFLEDELQENLDAIASEGNLTRDVFKLIATLKASDKLNRLYRKFCKCNLDNSKIASLKREIEGHNLTPVRPVNIEESDWQQLHNIFTIDNLPEASRAFLDSFEASLGRSFKQLYADQDPYNFNQIYQFLAHLDDPKLAITFADRALRLMAAAGNTTNEQRNQLTQWRDHLLDKHNINLADIQPPDNTIKQGYLLVSLEISRKTTQKDGAFVNVYSELHIVGQENPELFGGTSITCPLHKVAEHLCGLIQKAEQTVKDKITLELFLPSVHLEHDVAAWKLVDKSQELGVLGNYRPYLIRSFERARNEVSQTCISRKWKQLKDCVAGSDPGKQFHPQSTCPDWGDLEGLLSDATGLLLTAELSSDSAQRQRIISDIVKAAVPIALWFTEVEDSSSTERQSAFEALLQTGYVTDFANLAQQWRKYRINAKGKPERHLKLLCDYPDRWPNLPDANEDALVSFG